MHHAVTCTMSPLVPDTKPTFPVCLAEITDAQFNSWCVRLVCINSLKDRNRSDLHDLHHLFITDWRRFVFPLCWRVSWEKKIPLVRGGLEKTWLFHEIGWCYLELHRLKEARDYGVRSAAAADEIADVKWQINANVLVAQSECNSPFGVWGTVCFCFCADLSFNSNMLSVYCQWNLETLSPALRALRGRWVWPSPTSKRTTRSWPMLSRRFPLPVSHCHRLSFI